MPDLLLAGPILRRVTTELVCVWVATDKATSLKLTILQGTQTLATSDLTKLDKERCCIGKNLFVYLLQARPAENSTFPYDELLSYRIDQVSGDTEKAINLKALKLTYGNNANPTFANPTFFIPKQLKRLLHGSCRKPHGHAVANQPNYDALSLGDKEVADNHDKLGSRPAVLLLTGDQIYADDVTDSIFGLVRQKGLELLGYQEMLPDKDSKSLDPSTIPVGGRKKIADDSAGFSSQTAANHLFTFAEFAAMYVYVFGNAQNWTPDFSSEHNADLRAALEEFHRTLPNVRRLMANTPTYMIFDDHDVTDDWNITGGWYDRVRDLPLGHRVVSNALAAYWAFQGWGNEPDNFDNDLVSSVTEYLATDQPSDNLAQQYDLNAWKHRGWGFSVPTNPPVIVLDARTQRQPDGAFYPPQLMDRYALDWLRVEWLKIKVNKEQEIKDGVIDKLPEWPIFVAPTPVMGFAPVEGLQQFGLWLVGALEDNLVVKFVEKQFQSSGIGTAYLGNVIDAEAWISNRDGFGNFLNCILDRMNLSQCVFLSGDVHYSFTAKASFESIGKTLDCWQLTSSSLCNEPSAQQAKLLDKISLVQGRAGHNNWWAYNPKQRWKTKIRYIAEDGTNNPRVTPQCNIGLVEFIDGKPTKHTLLNDKKAKVFLLK